MLDKANQVRLAAALSVAFVLGAVCGSGLMGWARASVAGYAPAPSRHEVVLVLQTATPSMTVQPEPTVEPVPTIVPTVAMSESLHGAPAYARLGDPNAPVQIVAFEDPQCPFCRKHVLETERQLIEQYVKAGKAAITYRHFLFLGEESQRIAIAMACAGRQSREAFWVFHDYAYTHQFPENSGQATDTAMLDWAKTVQLDLAAFKACVAAPDTRTQVEADTQLGQRLGVRGTPTLFVNGKPLVGALPFDFVKAEVEQALAQTEAMDERR